jgi:outer membrane protein assembly factor BamB
VAGAGPALRPGGGVAQRKRFGGRPRAAVVCLMIGFAICGPVAVQCRATSLTLAAGLVSRPAVSNGAVFVAYDGEGASCVASYDGETGRLRWQRRFSQAWFDWSLAVCGDMVCVPLVSEAVYVLDAQSGRLRGRLRVGGGSGWFQVSCGAGRIFVAFVALKAGMGDSLVAFDAQSLGRVWRVKFADSFIENARPKSDTIEVSLRVLGNAGRRVRYERVVLRARDGRATEGPPTPAPAYPEASLSAVPQRARKRITALLRGVGGLSPRVQIASSARLVFLGNVGGMESSGAPMGLFAIRSNTGEIAWQRTVAGFAYMAVGQRALFLTHGRNLTALDARTGRRLWTAKLGA